MNCKAPRASPARSAADAMAARADEVAGFLGALASPHRLRILCRLVEGEASAGTLVEATGISQTSMSQHLARLREEGIVDFRRDHRTLFYRLSDPLVLEMMQLLHAHFRGDLP